MIWFKSLAEGDSMISACHHIALLTNNPKKLVNFYTKHLGFKIEKTSLVPKEVLKPIFGFHKDSKLIKLKHPGINLEIISLVTGSFKPSSYNRIGYSHWAYALKDRRAFLRRLKGITVIKVKKNNRYLYFIKDPDANLIEIQEL